MAKKIELFQSKVHLSNYVWEIYPAITREWAQGIWCLITVGKLSAPLEHFFTVYGCWLDVELLNTAQ